MGLAFGLLQEAGMDPGLVFALVIFGPLLLLAFMARTRFSWVPGVVLIIGACVVFEMIDTDLHGDIGGMGAIGLFVYGVILLVVGALLYRKPARSQPAPLPVATVVAGADER